MGNLPHLEANHSDVNLIGPNNRHAAGKARINLGSMQAITTRAIPKTHKVIDLPETLEVLQQMLTNIWGLHD